MSKFNLGELDSFFRGGFSMIIACFIQCGLYGLLGFLGWIFPVVGHWTDDNIPYLMIASLVCIILAPVVCCIIYDDTEDTGSVGSTEE